MPQITDEQIAALDKLTEALHGAWDSGVPRAEIESHIDFNLDNAEETTPQEAQ